MIARAAAQGHISARQIMARRAGHWVGTDLRLTEARCVVKRSTDCERAFELWQNDRFDEGDALLTQLADSGDPDAIPMMIDRVRFADPPSPNFAEHYRYWMDRLTRLAEYGILNAQKRLYARLFEDERTMDLTSNEVWTSAEAAERAVSWLLKVAAAGDPEARCDVWTERETVFPGPPELADRQALPWLEAAATQDSGHALYEFGQAQIHMRCPLTDRSRQILKRAAELGYAPDIDFFESEARQAPNDAN